MLLIEANCPRAGYRTGVQAASMTSLGLHCGNSDSEVPTTLLSGLLLARGAGCSGREGNMADDG
jgi:hypothetical protein